MAATAQSDLNALQTIVTADVALTNAQKAHCQTLLYALSKILLGPSSTPRRRTARTDNNTAKDNRR